jgi:hypothetical protein
MADMRRNVMPDAKSATIGAVSPTLDAKTYLSISFSFSTSKLSSQPTSIRIWIPPSNSNSDCDAGDDDWAPRRGVKLNMVVVDSQSSDGDCLIVTAY